MIEILIVCSALMCPEEFAYLAVPVRRGEAFSSYNIGGALLRPFCFKNRSDADGYLRIIEWTNRAVRIEASEGVGECNRRRLRQPVA